jgi:DNA-binding beta-propeller fold protein YncE
MVRMKLLATALAAFLIALGAPLGAAAAPGPDAHCAIPTYDDHCESWATLYNDPAFGDSSNQTAKAIAVSPDGSRVFVTGTNTDARNALVPLYGWVTVAFSAATGQMLWETKEPLDHHAPADIAVSPDGTLVFVTGRAHADDSQSSIDQHMQTVAYDAATGEVRWQQMYDAAGTTDSYGTALAVSADGSTLVVAGEAPGAKGGYELLVQAYDAAEGTELWSGRYAASGTTANLPVGVQIDPAGTAAYVGASAIKGTDQDFLTAAFSARPSGDAPAGTLLWAARYDGIGSHLVDAATDLGLSPDGHRVYITGLSQQSTSGAFFPDYDYATLAYDATTGAQLWSARLVGSKRTGTSTALAVSPAGDQIAVTGELAAAAPSDMWFQFGTVAYDAASGAQKWVGRYGAPSDYHTAAYAVAYSPDAKRVYATGSSITYGNNLGDLATVAYDTATGTQAWAARYNQTGYDWDNGVALAVALDSKSVFIAGTLNRFTGDFSDIGAVAYPS